MQQGACDLLSVVEKLADGIRLRHRRAIECALEEGANPNAIITLKRHERFSSEQAPVLYLAIHYNLPDTIQDLLRRGADAHRAVDGGLTPRAHAAWRLRWECLDAFDMEGLSTGDDDMVLSAIVSHWCEPLPAPEIEAMFFKRIDHLPQGFLPQPDLALRMLVSVLCGAQECVRAAEKLLGYQMMHALGARIRHSMQENPARFVPYLAHMSKTVSGAKNPCGVSDEMVEVLAQYDIDLMLPEHAHINPETWQWLARQQDRIDAVRCRKALDVCTEEATSQSRRGRL
jgi:hypothetical protein